MDNMRHGMGTFISSDGEKYEGNWKNDEKSTTYFKPLNTVRPGNSF